MVARALAALMLVLLAACRQHPDSASVPLPAEMRASPGGALPRVAGRYRSEEGDLLVGLSEGMVLFDLLVVSASGRTGQVTGEMTLTGDTGVYENAEGDCLLRFRFVPGGVRVRQRGSCEMGLGVSASGDYRSMADEIAAAVIGRPGDTLGDLFYGESETTYRTYCRPGMEEASGTILCRARRKSGGDDADVVQVFHGGHRGPDGMLPPLEQARRFRLLETRPAIPW